MDENYTGPERRKSQCLEHPMCIYRLELLEKTTEEFKRKFDQIQKLLIANLGAVCTLLVSFVAGLLFYIIKTH